MYQIIITANGDYIGGEVKSIHDLVKVFETEDQEEYNECIAQLSDETDSGRMAIFNLAEDEEFDLTNYLKWKK